MNTEFTKEKEIEEVELEVVAKVSKEEKEELIGASSNKKIVKYLVDQYYQSQNYRIRAQNQTRALLQGFDESDVQQFKFIEKELDNAVAQEALNKKYMDIVTDTIPVCRWMKSITGIGPVLSAYLYSVFDVKVGNYNTKFLSYAGLNDNNNPWLGAEKAKKMVRDAIEYRQEKFDRITEIFEDGCVNKTTFKKLITALKKLGKNNDIDHTTIKSTILEISGINIDDVEDINMTFIAEYINNLANPKVCDDILIDYISDKTGRNFTNVQKGTRNNWARKKAKSKDPTTEDLASYLAKPPYNTELKKMMYIVGDMFIKNSGRDKSLYGKIYKQKKLEYIRLNEQGCYAEQAKKILEEKNFSKTTSTYKALSEGRLSDAHINARARRYAVKLFISHVFEAMYYAEYRKEPPQTYVIKYMDHHDYIAPEVDYRPYIDGEL